MDMGIAFIYALCDPDTGDIRYVGKAKNPKVRLKTHCNEHGNTRKCRWVAKLAREGKKPLLDILEQVDESVWEQAECNWIAYCRETGIDLLNHTSGGEGVSGLDEDARKKVAAATKLRMTNPEFRARIFTKERARKISESHTGKTHSPEHVAKLPQNQPGWHHTPEAIERIRANAKGHRWSEKEFELMRERNRGNSYGLGNKSRTGMKNSLEMNEKISSSLQGVPKTEIQRQRMAEARRKWWERKKANVLQISQECGTISSESSTV